MGEVNIWSRKIGGLEVVNICSGKTGVLEVVNYEVRKLED